MHWKIKSTTTAGFLLWMSLAGCGVAQESHIGKLAGNAGHGKALYVRYCVFCHGPNGDGQGESAPYLNPKPRDFTKAVFKCRSTPSGSLPLDSDLYDTITRGVHASGMPSWKPLLRQERADLVAYIKTFSSAFGEEKPGEPAQIPPEPANSAESVKRGRELFQSMNCWQCHGKDGRGHGPSAPTLADNKGNPIAPFDFTSGKTFKCGETNRDMFRDLVTGLDGTPMPSFAGAMTAEQRWDVIHYIRTFSDPKAHAEIKTDAGGQ
ncbi:MAG TPA: c-type cytochrome [Candidatus Sulfotelmatobacter sp.]|jgi:mono/diheme cytochrome c family protein